MRARTKALDAPFGSVVGKDAFATGEQADSLRKIYRLSTQELSGPFTCIAVFSVLLGDDRVVHDAKLVGPGHTVFIDGVEAGVLQDSANYGWLFRPTNEESGEEVYLLAQAVNSMVWTYVRGQPPHVLAGRIFDLWIDSLHPDNALPMPGVMVD